MKNTWNKKVIWKKSLIGFLVCILFVSIAACSAKTNEPKSSEPAGSPSATEDAGKEGNKQTPVKLVSINANASFERKTDVERHVHDIIQEKTGVDLNVVFSPTTADYMQKMNLMLSSGEQLDIIPNLSMDQAIELYKNGAIIPLDDLIDQYGTNLKANFKPEVWSEVTADGKIIGIPSLATNTTGNVLQIRTDWLKELNLEKPVTVEDFEKVLEAFKQNKKDAYPLSTGFYTFYALHLGFTPYFLPQASEWWQDEQGQLLPPEMHPGYKDFMAKMIEWNKKGYIWPEMILSTPAKQIELIAQNKVGAVSGWYSSTIAGATEVLIKTIPEANYDPISLQGKGINKIPAAPDTQFVTVITKKSKNPEAAMKFLDYHASREGYALTYVGIEGESYTKLPDGTLEYIGEDKYDSNKASYYALYWMFQMDWDDFPTWPMSSWMDRKFSEMKKKTQELPNFKAIDQKVRYDRSQWKSFAKLTDLETFLDEQKIKVFTGELPLSDWDKIMQQWLDIGGKQMIEDRNAQFKAAQ